LPIDSLTPRPSIAALDNAAPDNSHPASLANATSRAQQLAPDSIATAKPAHQDGLRELAKAAPAPHAAPGKCDATSLMPQGGGISIGAGAEAGIHKLGASAQGSAGLGVFHDSSTGYSVGGFVSGGTAASNLKTIHGIPKQPEQPLVYGASANVGASAFITNAHSAQQLSGDFQTYSATVGIGPLKVSAQLARSGDIYQLSVGPPVAGETVGLSFSRITTNTPVTTPGCQ